MWSRSCLSKNIDHCIYNGWTANFQVKMFSTSLLLVTLKPLSHILPNLKIFNSFFAPNFLCFFLQKPLETAEVQTKISVFSVSRVVVAIS